MLTELHLSNFKSWRELDIKLGRVTGLFGTNSSGKSSILQFLLMLKQTKDATDRGLVLDLGGQNQLVNLGSFKDLIYKHQQDLSLTWSLYWFDGCHQNNSDLYQTSVETKLNNKEIKVKSLKFYSKNSMIRDNDTDMFLSDTDDFKKYHCLINIPFPINSNEELSKEIIYQKPPIKTHIIPLFEENFELSYFDSKNNEFNAFQDIIYRLNDISYSYEILMDEIYYLAPLREYPQREYQWRGSSPSTVGSRGENTINAILAATIRNETRIIPESNEEKPFQEVIAYWLKKLGLIHEFKLKEIAEGTGLFHAIVKKESESTEAFLTDVGFGVSQVLPAIVLLYYVPEGSIILMEQPEIHLHPSVQSDLADVILQVSKQRNIQVIVESHSEHLLQRFQRRVAEESYPVEELKLYFCDSQQGESKLMDLEIDEFGDIKNYPDNFFGDEMAEMAATHKAALKRKIQAQTK